MRHPLTKLLAFVILYGAILGIVENRVAQANFDQEQQLRLQLQDTKKKAAHYAKLLSTCLNGGTLSHDEYLIWCDRHKIAVTTWRK